MIITKKIQVNINPRNINHYKKHGLLDINMNDKIYVDINLLPKQSRSIVDVKCSHCKNIKNVNYSDYNKITNNGETNYYCKDCKSHKTKKTLQEKYGVDNVFQLNSVKEKIKKTIKNKYGVEHHLQNDVILNKLKSTNQKKYGVDFVQQNKEISKKREKTSIKKYGYKTSLLNNDVKDKTNKTLMEKYDTVFPLRNETILKKYKKTRIDNIKKKYNNINIIDIKGNIYTIKCDNGCEHEFDITSTLLYHRVHRYKTIACTICNKINSNNTSGLQTDFYNFIKENYNGNIIVNTKDVINPLELDIYLPELNFSFEFNGVYWHNELYKSKNYHNNKSNLCDEKGIQLIHIYEDDWVYKQDIVKSMILNKINQTSNKIFARKTEIKEITNNDILRKFLNDNHVQGFVGSNIKLGLFYNDELISLMTFGKFRKVLNSKSNEQKYEMLRFCNKLNTTIVGGASKMFKYFIRNYDPIEVISYADRSYSNGNLYKQLGFDFKYITDPNYYYVIDGIRHYRFNFRKDILVKQGYDKNLTEHQIMNKRGYYKIYNSGNYKFVYKKKRV